jgi:hypothetical protein
MRIDGEISFVRLRDLGLDVRGGLTGDDSASLNPEMRLHISFSGSRPIDTSSSAA